MKYKFVDIGTSHFSTSVDIYGTDVDGILVEPIKEYLDVIPGSDRIIKANYAISNFNGDGFINANIPTGNIYYASESKMNELKITNPNEESKIGRDGWGHLIPNVGLFQSGQIVCKIITFYKLCELYQIEEIEYLKIDTEGHDHIILEQVYDIMKQEKLIITDKIKFEYNFLANKQVLDILAAKFRKDFGFKSQLIDKNNQQDIILYR